MSRKDDYELWEKLRVGSIVVAMALLVVSLITGAEWLHYIRGLAFITAGVCGYLEARALVRLGRDPDAMYLRALMCVLFGVICFF